MDEKAGNFLCFIGKKFYTKETFSAEAARQGISRRIAHNQIPGDLISGKSKLFFAHEGGHDENKAGCCDPSRGRGCWRRGRFPCR